MTEGHIRYQGGYKYVLHEDYKGHSVIMGYACIAPFIKFDTDGTFIVSKGYAWDGPSGPTFDDKTNMRGSLGHDVKYQLMRMGLLPQSCRRDADLELQRECRKDGMSKFRAWYYFEGVDHFAKYAAKYGHSTKVNEAP